MTWNFKGSRPAAISQLAELSPGACCLPVLSLNRSLRSFAPSAAILALLAASSASLGWATSLALAQPAPSVSIAQVGGVFRVLVGEELFTEVDVQGYRKPICYPILGPHQLPMTRNYPMREGVAGEATDHPHHKSMWFAHGLMNDVSFWDEKGVVRFAGLRRLTPHSITFANEWIDPEGKTVCTDETTLSFAAQADLRTIDWDVTYQAGDQPLIFGDTKEGTLAIRTHPNLNLTNPVGADGKVVVGRSANSEGVTGKKIWGQRARWVHYVGEIDGQPAGIAIFDHRENLRHPTYWHAREYGLIAANPFGQNNFTGAGNGAHRVLPGETLRLRYRFVFHAGEALQGEAEKEKIERLYEQYR